MTDALDLEAMERRLQRFAEGENPRTIYKLPPNGRFDPLRADVAVLLSLARRTLEAGREIERLRSMPCQHCGREPIHLDPAEIRPGLRLNSHD